MAAGACDVGISNHYYLAQQLEDDPDFPVQLKWAEQDGRGVHVNISGRWRHGRTPTTPTWPSSSSSGWPPTARPSSSTPTTSTRPTRPSPPTSW